MDDCIFCKIVKGEAPSTKIYEDEVFLAFMNIYPATKGHALLVPKTHLRWMQDAPDEMIASIFVLAKKIMLQMKKTLNCDYVQITIIGEEVPHFHIHLIPKFGGQKLPTWTPILYEEGELATYAEKLKM